MPIYVFITVFTNIKEIILKGKSFFVRIILLLFSLGRKMMSLWFF